MLSRILGGTAIAVGVCAVAVLPVQADNCGNTHVSATRPLSFGIPGNPDCPDDPDPDNGGGGGGPIETPWPDPTGPCDAEITVISALGMAPFTVHVHGLNLEEPAECLMDAEFIWDFGDPGSDYNELEGWNAAHVYDEPGVYTITLTVIDDEEGVLTDQISIVVGVDTRDEIYVSLDGNDNNSGHSPAQAVRTVARAAELVENHTKILFEASATYNVTSAWQIVNNNVVIGRYGGGSDPVLYWSAGYVDFSRIINIENESSNVTVEDLTFSSDVGPGRDGVPVGIRLGGEAITVRNCHFEKLSSAMNSESHVIGWLTQDNTADVMGMFYAWNDGTDIVHVGIVADDSQTEHSVRGRSIERVLLTQCDLVNLGEKTNFVWMEGGYIWVSHNTLQAPGQSVGPHVDEPGAHKALTYARIETNDFIGSTMSVEPGARYLRLHDNIFDEPVDRTIEIRGYDAAIDRTTSNIEVSNNTIISSREWVRALNTTAPGVEGLLVARNLFIAPNFATGANHSANVYVSEFSAGLPTHHRFEGNVWALPVDRIWCDGVFYIWDVWFNCEGYLNEDEWDSLPNTHQERYRATSWGDLDADNNPTFPTNAGARR